MAVTHLRLQPILQVQEVLEQRRRANVAAARGRWGSSLSAGGEGGREGGGEGGREGGWQGGLHGGRGWLLAQLPPHVRDDSGQRHHGREEQPSLRPRDGRVTGHVTAA